MIASRIIAHRGCAALAPENTLAAMKVTQSLGIDWVEIDANLLADGRVVIFHDDTLDRLTTSQGELSTLSFQSLEHLDIGSHFSTEFHDERIPSLEEMLIHLSAQKIGLNLEIKRYDYFTPEQIVDPTITALENHWQDFDRLIISSFDHEILKLIHQRKPDWKLGQLWEGLPENWQDWVVAINAVSVHLYHALLTKDQAHAIKEAGLELYVYTVNSPDAAEKMFAMGVDGIFTDDPTVFR